MTRAELLRRLDSAELSEWIAYFQLEGEEMERAQLEARARAKLGHGARPHQRI